ncbi:MAG: DUF6671 family protein [Crocinitomicaceae bacterium]
MTIQKSIFPARNLFSGREIWIATQHQKEQVIGPLLKEHLLLDWRVPADFDTDRFGSFSGEVQREGNALDAARKKCISLLNQFGGDLVLASEGSFGPDPITGFGGLDDEVVLLYDRKNQREYVGRMLSNYTNFGSLQVESEASMMDFLKRVKFPSHGVIVRRFANDNEEYLKGIKNPILLHQLYQLYQKKFGQFYIETDMRALHNPTRMEVIQQATRNLIDRLQTICPQCETPGFSIQKRNQGLPCQLCGSPTAGTLSHTYCCSNCKHELIEKYPGKQKFASPQFCDHCNP